MEGSEEKVKKIEGKWKENGGKRGRRKKGGKGGKREVENGEEMGGK